MISATTRAVPQWSPAITAGISLRGGKSPLTHGQQPQWSPAITAGIRCMRSNSRAQPGRLCLNGVRP